MSGFAGHLPTKHFDQAEWSAMPIWEPKDPWEYREDGFFRTRGRNGKPVVVYGAPLDSGEVSYAVRPVVRVKMGRRVEPSQAVMVAYERLRCSLCGSRGMQSYCSRSRCPERVETPGAAKALGRYPRQWRDAGFGGSWADF